MGGVFISYRRDDTAFCAGRLHDLLTQVFEPTSVFMDVHSILPAEQFKPVIAQRIAMADVVLVLIGKHWLGLDEKSGTRRIDDQDDLVRFEIKTALEQNKTVAPILVDGMTLPRDLPCDLISLLDHHAELLSAAEFHEDAGKLVSWLAGKVPQSNPWTKLVRLSRDAGWPFSWLAAPLKHWGKTGSRLLVLTVVVTMCVLAGSAVYWRANIAFEDRIPAFRDEEYQRVKKEQWSRVKGYVVDSAGTVVSGVKVQAQINSKMSDPTTTIDDGSYTLNLLPLEPGADEDDVVEILVEGGVAKARFRYQDGLHHRLTLKN
jgi:hypothetical protein